MNNDHVEASKLRKSAKERYIVNGVQKNAAKYGPLHYMDIMFPCTLPVARDKVDNIVDCSDFRYKVTGSNISDVFDDFDKKIQYIRRRIDIFREKQGFNETRDRTIAKKIYESSTLDGKPTPLYRAIDKFRELFIEKLSDSPSSAGSKVPVDLKQFMFQEIERLGISEDISKCSKEIQGLITQYIDQWVKVVNTSYQDDYRYRDNFTKLVTEYEKINTEDKIDSTPVSTIMKTYTEIRIALINLSAFIIDVYVKILDARIIAKIFTDPNQYCIVYMGNDHIESYIKVLNQIPDTNIVIDEVESDDDSPIELSYGSKPLPDGFQIQTTDRCKTIPHDPQDIFNFRL